MRRNSSRGTMPSRILTLSTRVCAGLLFTASPLPAANSSGAVASAVNDLGLDLLAHATEPQKNKVLSVVASPERLTKAHAKQAVKHDGKWQRSCTMPVKIPMFSARSSLQRQLGELTERTTSSERVRQSAGRASR